MVPTYIVNVNKADKRLKNLSLVLFGIAFFSFWVFYIIELPIRVVFSNSIPTWFSYSFGGILLIGILSFILTAIKRNTRGLLKIHEDAVEVVSKEQSNKLYYRDLKRISFVVAT